MITIFSIGVVLIGSVIIEVDVSNRVSLEYAFYSELFIREFGEKNKI